MNKTIIDISRNLAPDTAVWPGDTQFNLRIIMSLEQGDSVNLTTLTISAHTGTHVDAPYHFAARGHKMDAVDLRPYWGLAQVVTVSLPSGPLLATHFSAYDLARAPRLLVRTPAASFPVTQFPTSFPHPSPKFAGYLSSVGVLLYGTDAPSMDDVNSKTLPGHRAMLQNGVSILEGLDLSDAPDGLYELCALPLKIVGGDGSPVRAVLRTLD
jgi:arylformamidase